jgi:hypothetical protein
MSRKGVLVLSLLMNFALLGAVTYLVKQRQPVGETPVAAERQTDTVSHAVAGKTLTTVVTNEVVRKIDWRVVESEDYRKYIANLRSIGCPEETIRDIIIADVNKLFESRFKALKPASKFKFWETGKQMFAGLLDEELIKQQQALAQEKRALLKELLGIEPEGKMDMAAMFGGANPFESMLDFLSPAKQTQVMELEQKYGAKLMKNFQGGAPDAEDMKEMQKVQKEKEAELAAILTPQEKQDYELRMSQTSMMMRMQLSAFDPNEQEFRDIFKVKKQFDDEYSPFTAGSMDKDEQAKRVAAQKEMDQQIKGVLGDSRYTEYQRAQDYTYQGLAKVADRQGLPKDAAVKAYDVQKAANEETQKVQSNTSLSTEQRKAALDQINSATETTLRGVLGDKGWDAYHKQSGSFQSGFMIGSP